ncbi:hypothetical protein P3S68_015094 [Capsicum galapagoense]
MKNLLFEIVQVWLEPRGYHPNICLNHPRGAHYPFYVKQYWWSNSRYNSKSRMCGCMRLKRFDISPRDLSVRQVSKKSTTSTRSISVKVKPLI